MIMANNPNLAMNFNVFENNSEVQELQKAQTYINGLNSAVIAIQGSSGSLNYTRIAAVDGSTNTIPAGVSLFILDPVALAASCIIAMPVSPVDGQTIRISAGAFGVTALTLSPSKGQVFSVGSIITTLLGNTFVEYMWAAGSVNKWFKIG